MTKEEIEEEYYKKAISGGFQNECDLIDIDLVYIYFMQKIDQQKAEVESLQSQFAKAEAEIKKLSCKHKWKETPDDNEPELQIYTCNKCGKKDVS